jgi:hypothetical protein
MAHNYFVCYGDNYCRDRFPENLAELGKTILGLAGAADHTRIIWPGRHLV